MPSQSHSPSIARCLLVATLFALGFLATVSLSDSYASRTLQKHSPSLKEDAPAPSHEKRVLGLGSLFSIIPNLPGIGSSLLAQVTSDINTLLPILNGLSTQAPGGVSLVTGGQAALPLTAQPLPTGVQLGGLADQLGSLLNEAVPIQASSIIAAITKQALGVVSSAEAIATDVASLGNQIASNQVQAPDAVSQIGGLLGSLDSKVNDIVSGVVSDLASDIPLPVLQDLSQIVSSELGGIVKATNGPLSLVGDLIEQNVCGIVTPVDGVLATVAGLCGDIPSAVAQVSSEIATAPLPNPDATLTGDASASTIFPASPTITGGPGTVATPTSPTQNSQGQGSLTNPITSNVGGSSSNSVGSGVASSLSGGQPPSNGNSASSPSGSLLSPGQSSAGSSAPEATGGQSPTSVTTSSPMTGSVQPGVGTSSQATSTSRKSG